MRKKFILFPSAFLLLALVVLPGAGCLSNPFSGWGSSAPSFGDSLLDNDAVFDLFEDDLDAEMSCDDLNGSMTILAMNIGEEREIMSDAKKRCDDIEAEYGAAASEGKDQATLDEIVKRHRSCLAGLETPGFGQSLENLESQMEALEAKYTAQGC